MPFRPRLWNDPALGFILLAAGLALIAVIGRIEESDRRALPWAEAIWAIDGPAPWTGTYALAARRIPLDNFPDEKAAVEQLRGVLSDSQVDRLGLDRTEWVIALAAAPGDLEPILESGRLPEPGTNEVLAGEYTRLDRFEMDDATYKVVGRLKRGVGSLYFSYVMPTRSPLEWAFPESAGWSRGWLDTAGLERRSENNFDFGDSQLIGGIAPSDPALAMGITAGLVLVLLGGGIVQLRVLYVFAGRRSGPFTPILTAMAAGPRGLLFIHGLLYGVFIGALVAANLYPIENMRMQDMVVRMFSEGSLAYVGDAYASANVPRAAAATFFNNYVLQTLALTLGISLIVPLAGVLKNVLSFGLAGFVLAPIWAGYSSQLLYHSITVTLELEAYVLASFAVMVFAARLIEGLHKRSFKQKLLEGLAVVGSAAMLTGILLAVAALYEATTLILLA